MAALDFGEPGRPVDLIFAHANGFNALTYRALLAPLAARWRIWAPDLRGHGGTTLPTPLSGRRGWADHRDDLTALLDQMDGPPVIMAGHSMGATASLLAAARRPDRVAGLVLLDPIIWTRPAALAFRTPGLDRLSGRIPLARNALRRRSRFDDRDQAFKAYRGRGAFRGWPDAMLRDYLADGLVAPPDGGDGLTLACAPEWEASNYAAQAHDPWAALARYPGPVRILRAARPRVCAVSGPDRRRPRVTVETLDDADHFFPMLAPDRVRAALEAALRASPRG